MARKTFLPLLAAAALLGGTALQTASAQTTVTTTTTTKTLGGITSQTTVTEETSVVGQPASPLQLDGQSGASAAAQAGSTAGLTGAPSAGDEVQTKDGTRYACSGVAADSRDNPLWKEFSAKLVFTAQGGAYLPDVLTRVEDRQGNEVFTMKCDGPWLLVDLPAASYKVVATAEDPQGKVHQRTADLSVGATGQSETVIRFNDIPG